MSFKDIVEACGPDGRSSNPVLRMVDMFTGDKSALQDEWHQHPPYPPHERSARMPPAGYPRASAAASAMDHQMRSFLSPEEFNAFEDGGLQAFDQLDAQNEGFDYHGPRDRYGMPYGPPSAYMPPPVGKFRSPHFAQERFFDPSFAEPHSDWIREYEDAVDDLQRHPLPPPPPPQLERRPMPMHQPARWVEEFEDEEFEAVHKSIETSQSMVDEFFHPETQRRLDEIQAREKKEQFSDKNLQQLASQFAQFDSDPKLKNSEFMNFMKKLSAGADTSEARTSSPTFSVEEFEAFEHKQTSNPTFSVDEFEAFEKSASDRANDFTSKLVEEFEKFDLGSDWAESFQSFSEHSTEEFEEIWKQQRDVEAQRQRELENKSIDSPYEFQQNNPYLEDADPFQKGLALFNKGNITEAILAFEAAVQKDPRNSIKWQYLGQAQAENDKDDLASRALLQAVRVDPENLNALMSLAVSYTNDFHKERALDCLRQWLASHPDYTELASQIPDTLPPDFDESHEIVTNIFLAAARMRPADPDPDVQAALGLLYNLSFEYSKAIDCFKAAVAKRPDDYLLWNRLGATQANSTRNEEAVEAYFHALDIKPTYTRARANLGISFLAMRQYGEAAKAFLSAISINPTAEHLWDNLRTVFSLMDRPDLLDKSDHRDVSLFADEFTF